MERPEARRLGLTRYKHGRSCKRGHVAHRMTSSGTCCECLKTTVASNKHRSKEAIENRKQIRAKKQALGKSNRSKKKYIDANPIKRKAHNAVNNAIKSGKLKRLPCEVCRSTEIKTIAHHDDYSKPLEVRWLCPIDHKEWHKNNEAING